MPASSRTTGSSTRRTGAGANSVRKIAASVETASAISTAGTVVTSVPQISGQARKYSSGWPGSGVPAVIARNCVTTSPPGPNQLRPLAEKDGHALRKTVTSISPISSSTQTPSAPSASSARLSVLTALCVPAVMPEPISAARRRLIGEKRRRAPQLVDRDPAGADDFFGDLVAARDPGEELQRFALGFALGHHPEVTHACVLSGLGVA